MDSTEIYFSVSLSEDNWRHLHAMLDFEYTNSAKALCVAQANKSEMLISFYQKKLEFLGVCMDAILNSLVNGNSDL